ncbi:sialic acid-binding Ig-like lectin 13 isoform X1 [Elephas maximus indicus]|uniref:sialic acid-binding Ig-like lectin 13 isoform X1 n=1 Tax=Elephas maximus indicus TaxID=99487 RepID=UPI0021170D6F|nr:sialic acid-binding Ig-like lectin 13 isoform X1 [Elephas maximus indicus]
MVPGPAPPTAEMLLLKLLLRLLWGIECAGSWGSQAGAGAPTHPRSSLSSWHLYDRHQLQVPKPMMVQEGLCVFIPCTFSYPPDGWIDSDPVLVYWFRQGPNNINPERDVPVATNNPQREVKEETKGRFQLLGDPQANNCSLYITGAQKSDSGKYIFRLERGREKYSYKDALLTVKVTALTNVPDIIMGSLESGCRSHVTCSVPWACDKGTPPTFSWMGAALGSQGSHSEAYGSSVIMLTPGPEDHGTNLTCQVTFPRAGVTTQRTVTLNVSYAPQSLTIGLLRGKCTELKYLEYLGNGSSLPILEGESLRLLCVADGNPLATQSWARGRRSVSPSEPWDPSVLELHRIQKEDEGEVTCRAQNRLGSQHVSLRLSVLSGERERGGEFVQAAFMGAGLTTLLFLCPCLIFLIVKTRRKKATKTAAAGSDASSVLGTIAWGHQQESWPGGPPDCPPPDVATPTSEEEQELHYASFVFHGLRSQEPQGQEATSTTEYSEIKIHQ